MAAQQYTLPPIEQILDPVEVNPDPTIVQAQKQIIEKTLAELGVEVRVGDMRTGPTLTQFGIKPGPEVKVSQIRKLTDDLALALGGLPVRLEDPTANYPYLRLIIPAPQHNGVKLRQLFDSPLLQKQSGGLKVGLGVDTFTRPVVIDLTTLPHLLIGGTTGSGKSVCLNTMIAGLLCRHSPQQIQLLLIDPLQIELSHFGGIPHLLVPVVSRTDQVIDALNAVINEMERRFTNLSKLGVRDVAAYNQQAAHTNRPPIPYIAIFLDNLTDLMQAAGKEVTQALTRIAAMGRSAGIHLVIATQRSNVDVVTGALKANAPARIAFRVLDSADSRLILDAAGAEELFGAGDMLYRAPNSSLLQRIQGVQVSDDELKRIVNHWQRS
ncbi:MAG: DNA translocase FtsK [Anaerolineae bacterium]|nr:DNA translocase FtsK [Anaerolineae bacterium]